GYLGQGHEGQIFRTTGAQQVATEISTGLFRFSVARTLFSNFLSLGVSFDLYQGTERLYLLDSSVGGRTSESVTDYGFSSTVGMMFQLPKRWFIGTSFHFPVTLSPSQPESSTLGLGG